MPDLNSIQTVSPEYTNQADGEDGNQKKSSESDVESITSLVGSGSQVTSSSKPLEQLIFEQPAKSNNESVSVAVIENHVANELVEPTSAANVTEAAEVNLGSIKSDMLNVTNGESSSPAPTSEIKPSEETTIGSLKEEPVTEAIAPSIGVVKLIKESNAGSIKLDAPAADFPTDVVSVSAMTTTETMNSSQSTEVTASVAPTQVTSESDNANKQQTPVSAKLMSGEDDKRLKTVCPNERV
jgi:hypothetical protein